jgi:hypothetical protein
MKVYADFSLAMLLVGQCSFFNLNLKVKTKLLPLEISYEEKCHFKTYG